MNLASEEHSVGRHFIEKASAYLLEDYLPKIERCLNRLTDEQVWWRPDESSNSIGNLLLHLSGNVRQWIVSGLGGESDNRVRDQEFSQREIIATEELLELLKTALFDVEKVLDNLNPDVLLESRLIQGKDVSVLEAVFHVTEHFSMHTGQIVLLTKLLTQKDLEFYDL